MRFFLCLLLLLTGCRERDAAVPMGFKKGEEVLRIASQDDPETLDPRKARDLTSATYLHMLFEGLTRIDFRGEPIPGIATEWEVSPDQKRYTFHLRESKWSNGEPLTAQDFVRTFRSVLNPDFPAPNAYQFYLIKGAKEAKRGEIAVEEVAISAPDSQTVVMELNEPAPFFPEMLATHFFYPVPERFDPKLPVGNGPFVFFRHRPGYEFAVKKNSLYWGQGDVHLDGVAVAIVDNQTALRLYENRELDWAGSPLGGIPQEAILPLKRKHELLSTAGAGVHWLRINTGTPPLNSQPLREALALAINRKELVEHVLQGNQKAALAVVPPALSKHPGGLFPDGDIPGAWEAFQKALLEMDLSKDDLPPLTLIYPHDERTHKVAQVLQQQWFKAIGVTVKLQRLESQAYLSQIKEGSFQLATGSWFADFRDPINFLEIFKSKETPTNATRWENDQFADLLYRSAKESDAAKRLALLNEAEKLLVVEMPVIPLYFANYNYVKDLTLLGVYFSDLGYLDFKHAFFSD